MADSAPLSRPPLNVLIDPSLARRKSPWEINLSELLGLFLKAIVKADYVDMRAAGTAALSSATIYRLKVETLFLFEKLRSQRRLSDPSEPPQLIVMPFRYEVYSTNIDELFDELGRIFQEIVVDESHGSAERELLVPELPPPNMEDYIISLTALLSQFRPILVERLKDTGKTNLVSEIALEPFLRDAVAGIKGRRAGTVVALLGAAVEGEPPFAGEVETRCFQGRGLN